MVAKGALGVPIVFRASKFAGATCDVPKLWTTNTSLVKERFIRFEKLNLDESTYIKSYNHFYYGITSYVFCVAKVGN